MKLISTSKEYRSWRNKISGTIGFVPTMGALHDGHLSLIQESNNLCKFTIVSIYVNPTQFSSNEDLDNYPQLLDKDIAKLSNYKVDALFLPSNSEMYPDGFFVIDYKSPLDNLLEGKSRPHFFKGVITIVSLFFEIIKPTHAFFGEKDAQQRRVIEEYVNNCNISINIITCPIIREQNGLAMSSRNQYLTSNEFDQAKVIFQALEIGKKLLILGERNPKKIKTAIRNKLKSEKNLSIDYLSISNSDTLNEISSKIISNVLVSIAVYIREVRLIDNFNFIIEN